MNGLTLYHSKALFRQLYTTRKCLRRKRNITVSLTSIPRLIQNLKIVKQLIIKFYRISSPRFEVSQQIEISEKKNAIIELLPMC